MKLRLLFLAVLLVGCGSESSTTSVDAGTDTESEPVDTDTEAPADDAPATTGATFAEVYDKVLEPKCSNGYCHGAGQGGWTVTTSAETTYRELVGAASSRCSGLQKVEPGQPEKSSLYLKMRGSFAGVCSGSKMPPSGGSATAAELETVRSWIAAGAKP